MGKIRFFFFQYILGEYAVEEIFSSAFTCGWMSVRLKLKFLVIFHLDHFDAWGNMDYGILQILVSDILA